MFSTLAKDDIDDLRAEGLAPTDEDVVRLHALAAKVANGANEQPYNMPRFAVCGGVVFHEPTVAAREWYFFAKSLARDEDEDDWFFFFASAKGRERGFLTELYDEREVRKAVKAFRRSVAATKAEVALAVRYAVSGDETAKAELTELAKKRGEGLSPSERERRNYADLERVMSDAAVATGLTFEDLMCSTPSRLCGYIYSSCVQAGLKMTKTSAAAHADYLATLDAVAKRLRAERDAAKGKDGEQ